MNFLYSPNVSTTHPDFLIYYIQSLVLNVIIVATLVATATSTIVGMLMLWGVL